MPIFPLNRAIQIPSLGLVYFLFEIFSWGEVFLFSLAFFFPLERGTDCCDEDTELPLLKELRTLAGRIEPITILPPLSNQRPPFNLLVSLFFLLRILILDREDHLIYNPTLDPRSVSAQRAMHRHPVG